MYFIPPCLLLLILGGLFFWWRKKRLEGWQKEIVHLTEKHGLNDRGHRWSFQPVTDRTMMVTIYFIKYDENGSPRLEKVECTVPRNSLVG